MLYNFSLASLTKVPDTFVRVLLKPSPIFVNSDGAYLRDMFGNIHLTRLKSFTTDKHSSLFFIHVTIATTQKARVFATVKFFLDWSNFFKFSSEPT